MVGPGRAAIGAEAFEQEPIEGKIDGRDRVPVGEGGRTTDRTVGGVIAGPQQAR